MHIFFDVDALCKCAHWDVLDSLPELLGFEWAEAATLSSLKYRALKAQEAPDGKIFKTAEAAKLANSTIDKMNLNFNSAMDVFPELSDVVGIDGGEAIIFSAVAQHAEGYVLTGDKRALRALSKIPKTSNIEFLKNKFICVEMLLLMLVDKYGVNWVREHFCPAREIDKTIMVILGSRCDANEESIREALGSYLRELYDECGYFLMTF
ncbi:MAG: hypothetical protein RLZZ601_894 [Pseudomonadota bacterium]|jgi:hypothetical protein